MNIFLKTTLLSLALAMAVFASGCENACERAQEARNELATLNREVALTLNESKYIPTVCEAMPTHWNDKLDDASGLARKISEDVFTFETTACNPGEPRYFRRTCDGMESPPRRDCRTYWVCRHHSDGYDESMHLSAALSIVKTEMALACGLYQKGDNASALDHLQSAHGRLTESAAESKLIMTKAGCFRPTKKGH